MAGDQHLRTTFDSVAAHYQAARPEYPGELYADLLDITGVRPPAHLLEVGCGPGKATLPLAGKGFRITAVELGEALAAEARRNLADFPDVEVITSSFEEWQPETSRAFDLVYAATAWGWVDPDVKYRRAAELLRPGGHLAVWDAGHGCPEGFDPFFTEIQRVYEALGEDRGETWPPATPDQVPDQTAEFDSSGLFEAVGVRRYVWRRDYSTDESIALLDTFSGHIAMDADKRRHLYAEIRRLLGARPDGRVARHWMSILAVGRRL